jgi:UDP-2,4-diacetamido-2,4,6-trideoxy-beta-L-altropyranose hydrolase
MVIDDLADRCHDCDVLLDQNLGRMPSDYKGLVPVPCVVLAGPHYALIRPEFAELRRESLVRRKSAQLRQLLISMGGVDRTDVTGRVLDTLRRCRLHSDSQITVVMGPHAPWLKKVQAQARDMAWHCEVRVDVSDMAQLMCDSDLAIGAGGSTSWERCSLGVPALIVTLAENQQAIAEALEAAGAVARLVLDETSNAAMLIQSFIDTPSLLSDMSACAAVITDGLGTIGVVAALSGIERAWT